MAKLMHKNNIMNKILFLNMSFAMISSCVFASDASNTDIAQDAVNNLNGGGGVYGTIGQIMSILAWLGFAIAAIKVLQIGMMFMLGAGGGKSNAKASLIPWLIGAFICIFFGTVGPWVIGIIMSGSSGGVFDI